jgi:hypothetical protein
MKTKNLKIDERIHSLLKRVAKKRETKIGLLANRLLANSLKTPAKTEL